MAVVAGRSTRSLAITMITPQWTPPTKSQLAAADEMVDAVIKSLRSDRGVHAETAIASAARMAGTFLFRSFNFLNIDAAPGSAVFSDAANDYGPLLIDTLGSGLVTLGLAKPSTDMAIPEEHKPHTTVLETQSLIEAPLHEIALTHNLTLEQAAHSCALVAARLIQMSAQVLEPQIGFALAAYAIVEGSKTMPAPRNVAPEKKGRLKWRK